MRLLAILLLASCHGASHGFVETGPYMSGEPFGSGDDSLDQSGWYVGAGLMFPLQEALSEESTDTFRAHVMERLVRIEDYVQERESEKQTKEETPWYKDSSVRDWVTGILIMLIAGERGYSQIKKKATP